jgi:hypothetical protein
MQGFPDPSSRVSAFDNRSGLAGSKGLAPIGRAKPAKALLKAVTWLNPT